MDLSSRWANTVSSVSLADQEVIHKWWTQIEAHYSEPERLLCNMESLNSRFAELDFCRAHLESEHAVALAILFQNYNYDPKSTDFQKKNDQDFKLFASEAGIPEDSELISKVSDLLELSSGSHSTDEHKTTDTFGSEDKHYFLDIDLAVLGLPPKEYQEYSAAVEKEYDFLKPVSAYKALRIKVLENFLQIPKIFATKEFHEKYEQSARRNIDEEIKRLKS